MPILNRRGGRMGIALEIGQVFLVGWAEERSPTRSQTQGAEMLGFVPHPNLRHCDVFGSGANTFTIFLALPILRAGVRG